MNSRRSSRWANDCAPGQQGSNAARAACAQAADLASEAARADKRASLEQQIASADTSLANATTVVADADADPLASTVASFAGALGRPLAAAAISPWLALIPVLFIELGSALSLVVLRPIPALRLPDRAPDAGPSPSACATDPFENPPLSMPPPTPLPVQDAFSGRGTPSSIPPDAALSAKVSEYLISNGGRVFGSQRDFAGRFGVSKSYFHEFLRSASACGRLSVQATAKGTAIALAN